MNSKVLASGSAMCIGMGMSLIAFPIGAGFISFYLSCVTILRINAFICSDLSPSTATLGLMPSKRLIKCVCSSQDLLVHILNEATVIEGISLCFLTTSDGYMKYSFKNLDTCTGSKLLSTGCDIGPKRELLALIKLVSPILEPPFFRHFFSTE